MQLLLPLEHIGRYQDELIYGSCNADAVAWLERFPDWPLPFFYIVGDEKSGKSTLARLYAQKTGGILFHPQSVLEETPENSAVIVDDAECIDEETLFHLYNRAKVSGFPLILLSKISPQEYLTHTKDLESRLLSFYVIPMTQPDEQTCRMLLLKQLKGLGIACPEGIMDTFLTRGERSYRAIYDFVRFIHEETLARQRTLSKKDVIEFVERASSLVSIHSQNA